MVLPDLQSIPELPAGDGMTTFTGFRYWEDEIIPIYLRVGNRAFTRLDIADIISSQAVTRYSMKEYFINVRDDAGRKLRSPTRSLLWRLHPQVIDLCQRALAERPDPRWENLAAHLTGGSECA
jgi:hypothetical protein